MSMFLNAFNQYSVQRLRCGLPPYGNSRNGLLNIVLTSISRANKTISIRFFYFTLLSKRVLGDYFTRNDQVCRARTLSFPTNIEHNFTAANGVTVLTSELLGGRRDAEEEDTVLKTVRETAT